MYISYIWEMAVLFILELYLVIMGGDTWHSLDLNQMNLIIMDGYGFWEMYHGYEQWQTKSSYVRRRKSPLLEEQHNSYMGILKLIQLSM